MMRVLVLFCVILLTENLCAQNELTARQKSWLYRIAQKSPVLHRNWDKYFSFDSSPFVRYPANRTDYDAIEQWQLEHPNSLQIQFDSIQQSSPGLISEAAIKLTLWELNEELKKCIHLPEASNSRLYKHFRKPLDQLIPSSKKTKRRSEIINAVIHPSLPIFKKIELLDELRVEATTQKKLLNKWRELVALYSLEHSSFYLDILSGRKQWLNTRFLAAGEGSGTAGLLYETEVNPQDSTKSWYGKGIGLFTYKVRTHKGKLQLQTHSDESIRLPAYKKVALHTSLWGLDSSFKPMIIVTTDTCSYHLFTDLDSIGLSPDPNKWNGISHLDHIEQFRQQKILNPLKELQNGPLNAHLLKEYKNKEEIELKLKNLESEIDTLLKYEPENKTAINHRKGLIESNLTQLTKKESRIKKLEQKFAGSNSKIAAAEKKLKSMEALLGPAPQPWIKKGNEYRFESGVVFDVQNQNLIIPASDKEQTINIRLLSASYSLLGKKKDEVQAYVSLTDALEQVTPKVEERKPQIDTTFTFQYYPDEYTSFTRLKLDSLLQSQIKSYDQVQFRVSSLTLPDSLMSKHKRYPNRPREYKLPLTIDGFNRKAELRFYSQRDTLIIEALGHADPVPTALSKAPQKLKMQLNIKTSSVNNNKYLVALRAINLLIDFIETKSLKLSYDVNSVTIDLPLTPEEIDILKGIISSNIDSSQSSERQ